MKLVTRMWLMFLVGFLALSTLGAVGYYGFTHLREESILVEEREAAGALAFQKTAISLANVQRATRNLLMLHESDDKFAGYVTRITDGRNKVNDAFAAAAATMYSEKGKQLSASIEQKFGEFYRHTDSLLAQAIEVRKLSKQDPEGKLTEQTQLLYSQSDKQQKTFRELEGLIVEASELKMQRLHESSERVKELTSWLIQFFAIVWLVSVAIF